MSDNVPTLTKKQQAEVLTKVHNFLATYDRVPGIFAGQWSNTLEALAVVVSNLNGEVRASEVVPPATE